MVLFAYVLSGIFWIILFLLIAPYLDIIIATIIATGYALYAFLCLIVAIVLPCLLLIELVKERNALRKENWLLKDRLEQLEK